jgi:tRNA (guanosine-2'-O-)-methyltransferase
LKRKKRKIAGFRTEERLEKTKAVVECRQPDLTVVLENIDDPHNLSAVVRSCDAVGVLEICLVYTDGNPFPELYEKSSASARKWVYTRNFNSIKECYETLRNEGKKIYTTNLTEESVSLYDLNLTEPVALVFGN